MDIDPFQPFDSYSGKVELQRHVASYLRDKMSKRTRTNSYTAYSKPRTSGRYRLSTSSSRRRKGKSYYTKGKKSYKATHGVAGQGTKAHDLKKQRTKSVTRRRKKPKKRVPSNKTLAKKVRKLEHKTRLSKYYLNITGVWEREDVGDNKVAYREVVANDAADVQDHLKNVPYTSTNNAPNGNVSGAYQYQRTQRTSLIIADNQVSRWNLSIQSRFEFKNMCTLPLRVSIYWCEAQKDCDVSPMNYINSATWRNHFYFNSLTAKNAFGTGAQSTQEIQNPGIDSDLTYPSHHKDLINTWKPIRTYHGVVEPAAHIQCSKNVGLINWNQKRYKTWDAFATTANSQYTKNTKPAFWLVRVEGIDVLDDYAGPEGPTHGTSEGFWLQRVNTYATLRYHIPGTVMVNHDFVDLGHQGDIPAPTHPGHQIHDNAADVTPQPPAQGP